MLGDNAAFEAIGKSFPTIADELKSMWGTPQFNTYLDDLEQDKTRELREGFPQDIVAALFAIGEAHDKQFPQLVRKSPWIS